MLELVHCQIISKIENKNARAYLLSESSMFVHEYQIVIKTCGTTTLLKCVDKLLELARTVGLTKIDNVFYNRQNFFFPERQLAPHTTFADESAALDTFFNNGGAYVVGRINENHYNFYNAECRMARDDPAMLEKDCTLEILMTGLNQDRMAYYHWKSDVTTAQVREETGIAEFFPNAIIDDYMFEPFGYSLNGLTDDAYFTIHITPQENCSFVSFETNACLDDYTALIQKVLACFQPSRFIITHLANALVVNHIATQGESQHGWENPQIAGNTFKLQDDIYCRFDHYDLFFQQYQSIATATKPSYLSSTTTSRSSSPSQRSSPQLPPKRRNDTQGSILKSLPNHHTDVTGTINTIVNAAAATTPAGKQDENVSDTDSFVLVNTPSVTEQVAEQQTETDGVVTDDVAKVDAHPEAQQ